MLMKVVATVLTFNDVSENPCIINTDCITSIMPFENNQFEGYRISMGGDYIQVTEKEAKKVFKELGISI